jgi:hypothetical protein
MLHLDYYQLFHDVTCIPLERVVIGRKQPDPALPADAARAGTHGKGNAATPDKVSALRTDCSLGKECCLRHARSKWDALRAFFRSWRLA